MQGGSLIGCCVCLACSCQMLSLPKLGSAVPAEPRLGGWTAQVRSGLS